MEKMEKVFFGLDLVNRVERCEISVNDLLSAIEDSLEFDFDFVDIVDFGIISVNCVENDDERIFYVE